mmetsp:Transcript_2181/g.3424  ORF Transcript_2181/g.3424 Transcript_2181/m.3424 type:complete len:1132 (-) Transcript_2181:1136-4531(-)
MVEIKPYLEEDEGEDENWIPLFPSTSLQSTEQSDSAAAAKNITMDNSGVEGAAASGLPTVDSEDDEDEGWQKLSSSHVITEHQSQAAPSVPSLMDFIPALSSITKVTSLPTPEENDGADSESEENIKWRRPNALDDTEIKHFRRDKDVGIFEEYNDDKISSMRIDPTEDSELNRQRSIIPNKSQHNIAKEEDNTPISSTNEEPTRKQQEHEQKQQAPPRAQQQQQRQEQQQRPPPSTRIKSKLQEKFIHDPLRSLPFHFLHNVFLEAKYQLTFAWKCYFIKDDDGNGSNDTSMDTGVLASLMLYSIVGLFALGLILSGIYDIGLAMLSTLIWSMETSVKTSRDGMCVSIYTTLILGMVIWLASRLKSREWFEATFRFPTLSNVVPVIVAFTSPSVYEVFVIGLSCRTVLVVCMTGLVNVGCPSGVSTVAVVVIAAAVSLFLVMNFVSWSELEKEEESDSAEMKPLSSSKSLLGKTSRRMRRYPHECHALGIVTLASFSIALILIRDGNFMFSSLRMLRICLSIGTGIFVLERLWDSILEAIAAKSDRRAAIGMSWRNISRRAMKQSLLDLSRSAFWSKDDTGNVVLGILSEEDSELRYAILGWIFNQWTATSNDQPAEGWRSTADDQPAEEDSPLNESDSSPEVRKTSDSAEGSRPPLRSDSVPDARSDDAKFDTKCGNDDSYSKAEFRADSESDRTNVRRQPSNSSYQSLQSVITRLDADEALIPTIDRYKEWVYSLRPNPNLAFCVAMWKQCPATVIFGVAIIWYAGRSFLQTIIFYTLGSTSTVSIGNVQCVCIIAGVLWPLLLMEYFSLSRWWKTQFKGNEDIPDSVMIMLESEDLSPKLFLYPIALATDTSALFLRVWKLLLESISFLESSVPAVRCATVAACTADLAADSLCLVDLVFEVQKRGVIGGVGMLIWDALNHHLKEELQQRRSNEGGDTDQGEDEELDSKYTGAVINSARNIGKISQNIGGLMNSKKDQEGMKEKKGAVKSDDNCEEGRSAEEDSSEIPCDVRRACSAKNDNKVPEVSTGETDSDSSAQAQAQGNYVKESEATPLQSKDGSIKLETKQTSQEAESEVKTEQKKEGENMMPVLIGGGLAVLGALVGGITVAAANNKNDEKRRSRESDGS